MNNEYFLKIFSTSLSLENSLDSGLSFNIIFVPLWKSRLSTVETSYSPLPSETQRVPDPSIEDLEKTSTESATIKVE